MKKFTFTCMGEEVLNLYTDSEKVIDKIKTNIGFITKTIPIEVIDCGESDIQEQENILVYLNHPDKKVHIDPKMNASYLCLDEEQLFVPDLVYLAIGMIANRLQCQQKYFVQSSVVRSPNGSAIMFIGDPNAGKTTLASKLLLSLNNGIADECWALIANDNVLIGMQGDIPYTLTGTKIVQMRYGALVEHFPELEKIYKQAPEIYSEAQKWNRKIYVDNLLKRQNVTFCDHAPITDIYLINTVKNGDHFIQPKDKIDRHLIVYEHLTKQIRSNRYALTSFGYPLPSFENEAYAQGRYDMAGLIADNVNIHEAKGDVEQLSRVIRKHHG